MRALRKRGSQNRLAVPSEKRAGKRFRPVLRAAGLRGFAYGLLNPGTILPVHLCYLCSTDTRAAVGVKGAHPFEKGGKEPAGGFDEENNFPVVLDLAIPPVHRLRTFQKGYTSSQPLSHHGIGNAAPLPDRRNGNIHRNKIAGRQSSDLFRSGQLLLPG